MLLLVSCGSGQAGEPAAPQKVPEPAADPPAAAALTEETAPGVWDSPACDKRDHKRSLTVNKGGGFTLSDMVAPCPPGKKCVW